MHFRSEDGRGSGGGVRTARTTEDGAGAAAAAGAAAGGAAGVPNSGPIFPGRVAVDVLYAAPTCTAGGVFRATVEVRAMPGNHLRYLTFQLVGVVTAAPAAGPAALPPGASWDDVDGGLGEDMRSERLFLWSMFRTECEELGITEEDAEKGVAAAVGGAAGGGGAGGGVAGGGGGAGGGGAAAGAAFGRNFAGAGSARPRRLDSFYDIPDAAFTPKIDANSRFFLLAHPVVICRNELFGNDPKIYLYECRLPPLIPPTLAGGALFKYTYAISVVACPELGAEPVLISLPIHVTGDPHVEALPLAKRTATPVLDIKFFRNGGASRGGRAGAGGARRGRRSAPIFTSGAAVGFDFGATRRADASHFGENDGGGGGDSGDGGGDAAAAGDATAGAGRVDGFYEAPLAAIAWEGVHPYLRRREAEAVAFLFDRPSASDRAPPADVEGGTAAPPPPPLAPWSDGDEGVADRRALPQRLVEQYRILAQSGAPIVTLSAFFAEDARLPARAWLPGGQRVRHLAAAPNDAARFHFDFREARVGGWETVEMVAALHCVESPLGGAGGGAEGGDEAAGDAAAGVLGGGDRVGRKSAAAAAAAAAGSRLGAFFGGSAASGSGGAASGSFASLLWSNLAAAAAGGGGGGGSAGNPAAQHTILAQWRHAVAFADELDLPVDTAFVNPQITQCFETDHSRVGYMFVFTFFALPPDAGDGTPPGGPHVEGGDGASPGIPPPPPETIAVHRRMDLMDRLARERQLVEITFTVPVEIFMDLPKIAEPPPGPRPPVIAAALENPSDIRRMHRAFLI